MEQQEKVNEEEDYWKFEKKKEGEEGREWIEKGGKESDGGTVIKKLTQLAKKDRRRRGKEWRDRAIFRHNTKRTSACLHAYSPTEKENAMEEGREGWRRKWARREVTERKEPIVSAAGRKEFPWPVTNKSKPPCDRKMKGRSDGWRDKEEEWGTEGEK